MADNENEVETHNEAWDCDPNAIVVVDTVEADLDFEDDTGDWQVLALDRFGDRCVNSELWTHRNEFAERAEAIAAEEAEALLTATADPF